MTAAVAPGTAVHEVLDTALSTGAATAAQVVVRRAGRTLVDAAVGRTPQSVDHGSSFRWFCGTKPLTAVTVGLLAHRGALDLHAPLDGMLAPTRGHPAGRLTLARLLTHTGGLTDGNEQGAFAQPVDELVEQAACAPPDPAVVGDGGTGAAYDSVHAWALMAGTIEAVTGRPAAEVCTELVLDRLPTPVRLTPAGCDGPSTMVVPLLAPPRGTPRRVPRLAGPRTRTEPNVISGAVGTARALADFYSTLADAVAGRPGPFPPAAITSLLACRRGPVPDARRGRTLDYAGGFQFDMGAHLFSDGPSASSFGHGGGIGPTQVGAGYHDPVADVVVAIHLNGLAHRSGLVSEIVDAAHATAAGGGGPQS